MQSEGRHVERWIINSFELPTHSRKSIKICPVIRLKHGPARPSDV